MLIFWSLVRNSVVLAVYLLFSVACFLTVHEHFNRVTSIQPLNKPLPWLYYYNICLNSVCPLSQFGTAQKTACKPKTLGFMRVFIIFENLKIHFGGRLTLNIRCGDGVRRTVLRQGASRFGTAFYFIPELFVPVLP